MKNLLLLLSLSLSITAQTPSFLWAKSFGGSGNDWGNAIATDPSGNVYTTGSFSDTVDFDPGPGTFTLPSAGSESFISKLDAAGNFIWAKKLGVDASGMSINIDGSGNILTTGLFNGIADFDPGPATYTLAAAGPYLDIFISKLDASGNFVWAKQINGTANDIAHSLTLDALGNVYTTGAYNGTADFDPGPSSYTLYSAASSQNFVLKLDASGNFVWTKQFSVTGYSKGYSIALDASGNVYTTGHFKGTADFDPGPATSTLASVGNSMDIFVSKLDAAGNFVWVKQMGGTGLDDGHAISLDAAGNVYCTGYFSGTANFDPGPGTYTLTSGGTQNMFISKLNSAGNFIWAKHFNSAGYGSGYSIGFDAAGNVYTTGYLIMPTDFDPGPGTYTLNSVGTNHDIYISKLDSSGNFLCAGVTGGIGNDQAHGITLDPSGNIYIVGDFENTVDFDPSASTFNLTSTGGTDVFISKFSSSCITVGLKDHTLLSDHIIIYPNPNNGQFHLNLNDEKTLPHSVAVQNVLGETILNLPVSSKNTKIDFLNAPKGIYMVLINYSDHTLTQKIIKD